MNHLSRRSVQTKNQLLQKLSSPGKLPWFIICLGIILRLVEYLFNRSLNLSESSIALTVINGSFLELLQPSGYVQAIPSGFLIFEKLAVQAFGNSEYALRLFPLLFGIVSLFLFYELAKRCINTMAALISLSLFAISDPLIYYSSVIGQFSGDLTIALLLFLLAVHIQSKRFTAPVTALFGIAGAIAVWFSHPSIFVLVGTCISLIL